MSTYAIGDLQGCFTPLQQLLAKINFNPAQDKIWFVGDLVNRGPDSLQVLRFVRSLGDRAVTVLGNHDLHLLAVAYEKKKAHRKDTLQDLLQAEDASELLEWLRHCPLLHRDTQLGFTMIHAGLAPEWTMEEAQLRAREVEDVLRSPQIENFLAKMYGNEPARWSPDLAGWDRIRFIANCFTRLRYADEQGNLALQEKGDVGSQPAGFLPWFQLSSRLSKNETIVFGHWSTLGEIAYENIFALDTGCLWGGKLTALRLEDRKLFQIDCEQHSDPMDFF